jgi:hypothetical protein
LTVSCHSGGNTWEFVAIAGNGLNPIFHEIAPHIQCSLAIREVAPTGFEPLHINLNLRDLDLRELAIDKLYQIPNCPELVELLCVEPELKTQLHGRN